MYPGILFVYSTFNTISVIMWQSVLLVEETGVHYFSYNVAVSFIGGGNWSTWGKEAICQNHQQTMYKVVSSTPGQDKHTLII